MIIIPDIHQDASNDVVLTNITDQLWQMDDITWRFAGSCLFFFVYTVLSSFSQYHNLMFVKQFTFEVYFVEYLIYSDLKKSLKITKG